MSIVAVRKRDGQAEMQKYTNRPQIWPEPGDAQWAIQQRYGSGATADFEFITLDEWEARKAEPVEVVAEPADGEGLVIVDEPNVKDEGDADGGTA